jgi:nucleoside-diphosphate-sugar epimerase
MSDALPVEDLDRALSLTPEFWPRFSGARLFITGGTGFIGNWLLSTVQRANDTRLTEIDLVVLTRDSARARQNAPRLFSRDDTTLVQGDVQTVQKTLGHIDLCIHAATDVGSAMRASDPVAEFESIVFGTHRVLDLAQANGASRFLLTSSGAVYGPQPAEIERVSESYTGAPDPLRPQAAYGNGKRAAEWMTAAHAAAAAEADFHAVIARIYALLGPGMPLDGSFAAGNFIRDALMKRPIAVQGDGRTMRSYLYMADLSVWLFTLLGFGKSGEAYNVGSENAVSIRDLADRIAHASRANSRVDVQAPDDGKSSAARYIPDTSKARRELGLAEYTALDLALEKTIKWSRTLPSS